MPHINEFVEKEAQHFANFQINYVNGADPVLDLVDQSGNTEQLSIDNWKTENIKEFLEEKLAKD